jgi:hypothetical protein
MATPLITEKELRIFAMDRPEFNTLVDGVKFGPEEIEQAQIHVVDYFNLLPPPLSEIFTVENFPSRILMLIGVWGHLLRGASIGETQNELEYSADGVQINDRSHGKAFAELGNQYWQEFIELAKQTKTVRNIHGAFGSHGSEWRYRARVW